MQPDTSFHSTLAFRKRYRDDYWRNNDPIAEDRLLWRAQAFRHAVHLFPGQTILELGCGDGLFTRALLQVCRGENPITAVTFQQSAAAHTDTRRKVEVLELSDFSTPPRGRRVDCVVAMDLVDRHHASQLLRSVYELLGPGGKMVFYESNPLNPFLTLRRLFRRLLGSQDARRLLSRSQIYNLLVSSGFVQVYAIYNDFVFPPLTRRLIWLLRNLSILLENAPGVRTMAGSIFLHAQKPPGRKHAPRAPLFTHKSLRGAVSFVIPCHNEEMNIRPLVGRILDLYRDYVHEIILVNDGSNDGTATVIEEIGKEDARV